MDAVRAAGPGSLAAETGSGAGADAGDSGARAGGEERLGGWRVSVVGIGAASGEDAWVTGTAAAGDSLAPAVFRWAGGTGASATKVRDAGAGAAAAASPARTTTVRRSPSGTSVWGALRVRSRTIRVTGSGED